MATWKQENIMLTKTGEQALANAEAGEGKIHITRVIGSSFSPSDLYNVTSSNTIPQNITFSIIYKEFLEGSTGTGITIQATNKDVTAKFNLNTIIVFATQKNIGSGEFPYLIAKAENADEVDISSITPTVLNFSLNIVNTRGGVVNITVSNTGLATSKNLEDFKDKISSDLGAFKTEIGGILDSKISEHNTDLHAHDNRFNNIIQKINNMVTPTDDSDKQDLAPTLTLTKKLLKNCSPTPEQCVNLYDAKEDGFPDNRRKSGSFNLKHPYTDYDFLFVLLSDDNGEGLGYRMINVPWLEKCRLMAIATNHVWVHLIEHGGNFWYISTTSTPTNFVIGAENSNLWQVWGYKLPR